MILIERDGKKYIDEGILRLIENGNNDELVTMLQNKSPKDVVSTSGTTLLHCSAFFDNYFMTEFLINWGVDVNAQDEEGDTPLLVAADRMHYDQVKLLLNANADFKVKNSKSKSAFTMNMSLWHEDCPAKDIFELLFNKLKMHHPSIEEMVEILISSGCHLSDVPYFKYPYTTQFIHTILQKKYYHINSQNNQYGQTVLHTAAKFNDVDLIKELLLLGSDPTIEDKHCFIPFIWHILINRRNQNQEIVKMLIPKEYNWMQLFKTKAQSLKTFNIKAVFTNSTTRNL